MEDIKKKKTKQAEKVNDMNKVHRMPCIAKTAKGTPCIYYGNLEQKEFKDKFCKVHHYQAGLTQDEWDKITLCTGCKSWKVKSKGNSQCDHCLDVGSLKREKNSDKTSLNKLYCKGICRGNNGCKRLVTKEGTFCDRHTYQSLYSKEDLGNMQECLGCRMMFSVKSFSGGKSCDSCKGRKNNKGKASRLSRNGLKEEINELVKEDGEPNKLNKPKKPKKSSLIRPCVASTISKQKCQNDGIIDISGQMFCKFHSNIVKAQNELTKAGKKKCSTHDACGNLVELKGKYNTCEDCRKKDRKEFKESKVRNKKRKIVIEDDNGNKVPYDKNNKIDIKDNISCDKVETDVSDDITESITESIIESEKTVEKEKVADFELERERKNLFLAMKNCDERDRLDKYVKDNGLDKCGRDVEVEKNKVSLVKKVSSDNPIDIIDKIVTKQNNKFDADIASDSDEDIDEKKELDGIDLSKYKMSSCTKCGKEFQMFTNKLGKLSFKCEYCLGMQRKVEVNRGKRKRDWKGELDKNPERKAKKDKWKDDNADKVALYDINAKGRRIEKEGDGYWIKNAEQAKINREQNPIRTKEKQVAYKMTSDYRIKSLKSEANIKNLEWNLSEEEASDLVMSVCHYCGSKNKQSVNTIDRIDSSGNYEKDNCVSSCTMCNDMKNTLNYYHFLQIIEHLCAYNKLDNDAKCDIDNIPNRISGTYNDYKTRHINKKKYNKESFITFNQYITIISQSCYVCGKINGNMHRNGIDRIDNTCGYELQNCKTCCATCNYLKSKYDIEIVHKKLIKIYMHRIKKIVHVSTRKMSPKSKTEYNRLTKQKYRESQALKKNVKIKKTKEQLKEEARLRKEKSRKAMKEKMGDDEWKKNQALQRANCRKKAKDS